MSTPRRHRAVVVGPPLVVLAAWAGLGWWPTHRDLATAHDRQVAAELATLDVRAQAMSAGRATAEEEANGAAVVALTPLIPEREDLGTFLVAHDDLATAQGLAVVGVTPTAADEAASTGAVDPASLPAGVQAQALTMALRGPGTGVTAYLRSLHDLERLVVLDGVTRTDDGDGAVELEVQVRLFWAPPAVATG